MEYDKILYWQNFMVWIVGLVLSVLLLLLLAHLFNGIGHKIMPVIFFSPLLLLGGHGLIYGYSNTYRINYIRRGKLAKIINIAYITLYIVVILIFSLFIDPS